MPFDAEPVYKCNGEMVADTNQKTVIAAINEKAGGDGRELVEGGVCVALSKKWIADSFEGKDYWNSLSQDDVLAEVKREFVENELKFDAEAAKLLNIPRNRDGSIDFAQYKQAFLKATPEVQRKIAAARERSDNWAADDLKSVMKAQHEKFDTKSMSQFRLIERVSKTEGFFMLHFNFKDTDGKPSAHTVAVHNGPSGVHLMDPNAGEMRFEDRKDFQRYFTMAHCQYYADAVGMEADHLDVTKMMIRPDLAPKQHTRHVHASTLQIEQNYRPAPAAAAAAAVGTPTPPPAAAAVIDPVDATQTDLTYTRRKNADKRKAVTREQLLRP